MTPKEQRIAIAEACGWTPGIQGGKFEQSWGCPRGCDPNQIWKELPDYLNDLNVIREACLHFGPHKLQGFCTELRVIVERDSGRDKRPDGWLPDFWFYNASAAQHSEACLKTLNLWTDAPATSGSASV